MSCLSESAGCGRSFTDALAKTGGGVSDRFPSRKGRSSPSTGLRVTRVGQSVMFDGFLEPARPPEELGLSASDICSAVRQNSQAADCAPGAF
jgi:hypothetical protein